MWWFATCAVWPPLPPAAAAAIVPSVSGATQLNVTSNRKPAVNMQGLSSTVMLVTFTDAMAAATPVAKTAAAGNRRQQSRSHQHTSQYSTTRGQQRTAWEGWVTAAGWQDGHPTAWRAAGYGGVVGNVATVHSSGVSVVSGHNGAPWTRGMGMLLQVHQLARYWRCWAVVVVSIAAAAVVR